MKIVKYWLPLFLWALIIFTFSSMVFGASAESYWFDFLIKKSAHVIEYGIFYVLSYRALRNTTKFKDNQLFLISFIMTVIYAISDEFHQSFTPGREPNLRDVFIDAGAGLAAWILIWKWLPKAPKKLKTLANNLQIA